MYNTYNLKCGQTRISQKGGPKPDWAAKESDKNKSGPKSDLAIYLIYGSVFLTTPSDRVLKVSMPICV